MIWLSYPLLLGILVCIFISLLAILSVFKQTMLRLKISIVLAAVIILFVVFFQDNYITDAYRQEWKLVKVLEIAMSVLLVVAGVAGHLKGKQSSQPTESSKVDNLLSHGELPVTEETEENANREDAEGNEQHGDGTDLLKPEQLPPDVDVRVVDVEDPSRPYGRGVQHEKHQPDHVLHSVPSSLL